MSKYSINKSAEKFLFKYLNNAAPTGVEAEGQKIWLDYISPFIEKHEVDGWLWFTETLDKIKKDRRNARRRHLYWEKKNPEEAKRRKNLMEFYFKAAGVPEPLLPSLFLKAKKNKESSGVIKFRRYKKTDER